MHGTKDPRIAVVLPWWSRDEFSPEVPGRTLSPTLSEMLHRVLRGGVIRSRRVAGSGCLWVLKATFSGAVSLPPCSSFVAFYHRQGAVEAKASCSHCAFQACKQPQVQACSLRVSVQAWQCKCSTSCGGEGGRWCRTDLSLSHLRPPRPLRGHALLVLV